VVFKYLMQDKQLTNSQDRLTHIYSSGQDLLLAYSGLVSVTSSHTKII